MSSTTGAGRRHFQTLEMVLNHGAAPSRRADVLQAMEQCLRYVELGIPVNASGGAWATFVTRSWAGIPGISEFFAHYLRPEYIDMTDPLKGALRLQAAIMLEHPLAFAALLEAGVDESLVPTSDRQVSQPDPESEPIVIRNIEHMIELDCSNENAAQEMLAALRLHRMQRHLTGSEPARRPAPAPAREKSSPLRRARDV